MATSSPILPAVKNVDLLDTPARHLRCPGIFDMMIHAQMKNPTKSKEEEIDILAKSVAMRTMILAQEGGIQLEWYRGDLSLEFEHTPSGWDILGVDRTHGAKPKYYEPHSAIDTTSLPPYLDWFINFPSHPWPLTPTASTDTVST